MLADQASSSNISGAFSLLYSSFEFALFLMKSSNFFSNLDLWHAQKWNWPNNLKWTSELFNPDGSNEAVILNYIVDLFCGPLNQNLNRTNRLRNKRLPPTN